MEVYEIVHTSPELKTVYDFIVNQDSPAFGYAKDPESFLTVKNNEGDTNRQVIEQVSYNDIERRKYAGKSTREMILKVGTRVAIEKDKINRAALLTEGIEIVSYDIPAFKAQALAELEAKEGYTVQGFYKPMNGQIEKGSVRQQYPDATVWVWCRSLANAKNNYQGEIFNVTPFLQSLTTDVTKGSGGNFEFRLPPLVCSLNDNGEWVVKRSSITFYQGKNLSMQKSDFVAQAQLHEVKNGEQFRNSFLFHNILSSNDLVFIRFETLQVEQEQRVQDASQLYICKEDLPDRIYDMIGLIDVNSIQVNPANTDVTISISGRDLMKLLIEDGTYVYNLEMSQGMLGGPGSALTTGLSARLAADKSLQYLSLYFNNSIERVMKFVLSQLSNIKVVPDSLFDAYGSRRNARYLEDDKKDEQRQYNDQFEQLKNQAIQQITDLRNNNGSAGLTFFVDEEVVVQNVYRELKRFLRTIRSKKVRTVLGNVTVGWKAFSYQNERSVTEKVAEDTYPAYFVDHLFNINETTDVRAEASPIIATIDSLLDLEDSKSDFNPITKKVVAPGIWQIIKLVLDEGVSDRRIVDSSLSSANGSLLNYFQKVCQNPFVEFYGDTYGDMYYLTARKPPTDKAGVMNMLNGHFSGQVVKVDSKDQVSSVSKEASSDAVINIEADDVLFEQLMFDDSEVYSWYHLTPYANLVGNNQISLSYLPAIFFKEYADIWGSRPMQLQHNYMPAITLDAQKQDLDLIQKQAVTDLKYVIESSAYLPFTRKGTIKTNGDRRYKVGNLVRYKPTGEIFHVDHVKNEWAISESSIERTSSIQVSRGMIEQLIYGIPTLNRGETEQSYISYFNIINTKPKFESRDVTSYISESVKVGTETITTKEDSTKQGYEEADGIFQVGNINMQVLDSLPDSSKRKFYALINAINKAGYWVACKDRTSAMRTFADQVALHKANELNAVPGTSRHEFGRALDINIINKLTKKQYFKATSRAEWLATGIPQLAQTMGYRWGGIAFKHYYDPVHFEWNGDSTPSKTYTQDKYETRKKPVHSKELDTDKIFSNFKVNKDVFEFFLRREQMDPKYSKLTSKKTFDDEGSQIEPEIQVKAFIRKL